MDTKALKVASDALGDVINSAKLLAQSSDGFAKICDTPGAVFCPAIPIYAQALRSSGFQTFDELDQALKNVPSEDQDTVEGFWNVEDEWDELLKKISASLGSEANTHFVKNVGDKAPISIKLENARKPNEFVTLKEALLGTNSPKVHLILLRHLS